MARDGRHSAKGNSGEELQCDAWEVSTSRRWPSASPERRAAGGAAPVDRGSRKGGRRLKKGGSICKFRKFQGPYCKSTITFKLGLK